MEWKEIWEDASGGKWDMSFCLTEGETEADLDASGSHAGIGDSAIFGSDCIPKIASGRITEENCGFIYDVIVLPTDIRGRGVGSCLVEYMMEWMKDRGCKGCCGMFQDDQDNEARERFWRRLGFDLLRDQDGKVKWIKRSFD